MNTSEDFKSLWAQQDVAIPDINEIFNKASNLKKKTRNKLLLANLTLGLTSIFIVGVVLFFHPEYFTTKLGVVLIIISIVSYLGVANRMLPTLSKTNPQITSKNYLKEMIELKQKQEFLQTKMLSLYFILLTAGITLYMIEYTLRMSVLYASVTYAVTFAWIAFNWFYLRKKTIKKQQNEINAVIDSLQKVNQQMDVE